jgi:hypothetical protein
MLLLALISVGAVYLATETHQSEIAEEQPPTGLIVAAAASAGLEAEDADPAVAGTFG